MARIVMIDECKVDGPQIRDSEPVYEEVKNFEEAREEMHKFIGRDVILTTFWGTWENTRALFMCHDMMTDDLKPNKQATLAYLGECIPGTMHIIYGPVVGFLDPELW
jgi:hypothetical protein